MASTKTKAELLEEDDNAKPLEADFERFEVQESIKDWATQVYAAKWILKQRRKKSQRVPLILDEASRIFSRLTMGAIYEDSLNGLRRRRCSKQMANGWKLSIFQKALNQLYVAIRFAFIFQLAKKMKIQC